MVFFAMMILLSAAVRELFRVSSQRDDVDLEPECYALRIQVDRPCGQGSVCPWSRLVAADDEAGADLVGSKAAFGADSRQRSKRSLHLT